MKHLVPIFLISSLVGCACTQSENKNVSPTPQVDGSAPGFIRVGAVLIPVKPAPSSSSPKVGSHSACPADMVEINGEYCPTEDQMCLFNTDIDGNRLPGPGDLNLACGEYRNPVHCLTEKVHMHFCIDKYEWPNKEGQVPQDWMTFFDAQKAVASVGKRLCTHKEWSLAAEGPDMHPLPYGDGFHRSKLCNFDNHNPGIDVFQSKNPNDETSQKLRALLVPSGSKADCVSGFGVHDMAGNIDEWVVNESSQDMCINKTSGNCRTGLMGGHIWHVRNASRPMTTAHGAGFSWYETGTRACKDAE